MSSSASYPRRLLVLDILNENFGPIVKIVAAALMTVDKATLTDAHSRVRRFQEPSPTASGTRLDELRHGGKVPQITLQMVREALLLLNEHNMLEVSTPTEAEARRGPALYYRLRPAHVIWRLRAERTIHRASDLYGPAGAVVAELLWRHGRMTIAEIREDAASQLASDAAAAAGMLPDAEDDEDEAARAERERELAMRRAEVETIFRRMVRSRHVAKVVSIDLVTPSPPPDDGAPPPKSRAGVAGKGTKAAKAAAAAAAAAAGNGGNGGGCTVTGLKRARSIFVPPPSDGDEGLPVEVALMVRESGFANGSAAAHMRDTVPLPKEEEDEVEWDEPPAKMPARTAGAGGGRKPTRGGSAAAGRGGRGGGKAGAGGASSQSPSSSGGPAAAAAEALAAAVAQAAEGVAAAGGSANGKDGKGKGGGRALGVGEVDPTAAWKIGMDQFHRDFRHDAFVKFVWDKWRVRYAEDLMRRMLRLSMPSERSACEPRSVPIPLASIEEEMRDSEEYQAAAALRPPEVHMQIWLNMFGIDSTGIVSRQTATDGGGGLGFIVNLERVAHELRVQAVQKMLRDRYDAYHSRAWKVLVNKKYLEQGDVANSALVPPKVAREALYQLYRDRFVTMEEVPKRADHHHAGTTNYLWTVNHEEVREAVVDGIHDAILRARTRRQAFHEANWHEIEDERPNGRTASLDKQQRQRLERVLPVVAAHNRLLLTEDELDDQLAFFDAF